MGAYWKEGAKSRHAGGQAYLSHILQFSHRVTNKVAIETDFSCIPTVKESNIKGRERTRFPEEGRLFETFGLGDGRFFGGGGLLEGRRFLFEEIRYSTTRIPHSSVLTKLNQQNISERGFGNQK